mmetsp:Transcript_20258/g.29736  ORF Transcript_20258/g.29736 Transcript_20258/m.29736 type:complete len:412 (+) Transcript_20258:61-1296(+)
MSWAVDQKLRSFIQFAKAKLDSAEAELTDEDEEDNYQELVVFTGGLTRNLKNVGAAGTAELKGALLQSLMPVWNIGTDQPGPELRSGGVPGLRAALDGLLTGPLAGAKDPEPPAPKQSALPSNLKAMTLQDAVTYMWVDLDKPNRCEYGDDGFSLYMQEKGKFGRDTCKHPLIDYVNEKNKFWEAATTKTFIALLDNYEREVGKVENITSEEKREMSDFLDALGKTEVIQFCLEFLKVHGKDARCKKLRNMADFQNLMFDLWLAPYRRKSNNDSSGFEHVFVGEEKDGKITGLHNWIQYYIEEQKGKIDYQGWSGKQDSDLSDDVHLVTVKFAWADDDPDIEIKPMSTMLCGSTVEFEMAILTMVFLTGNQEGKTQMMLGNEKINVTCYPTNKFNCKFGGPKIMSAYIEMS